jgi:hypothetical protein
MDSSRQSGKAQTLKLIVAAAVLFAAAMLWTRQLVGEPGPEPSAVEAPAPLGDPMEGRKSTEAERKAAIRSIQGQLDAFKAGDFEKAVSYQSAGLKENFASTEAFRQMMERSYPQFVRWTKVSFGESVSDESGDRVHIPATVTGEDGRTVEAVYLMRREDGLYKVEGVGGGFPRRLEGTETL